MSIYKTPRLQQIQEGIGRKYERQIGRPANNMLPDVLSILTSPGILPDLKDLIAYVEEQDRIFGDPNFGSDDAPTEVPQHERMVLKLDDAGVDYEYAREWMNHILALAFAEGASAMHWAMINNSDIGAWEVENPYPISHNI